MKKKYYSPEVELTKFQFESMLADPYVDRSENESPESGGEELDW